MRIHIQRRCYESVSLKVAMGQPHALPQRHENKLENSPKLTPYYQAHDPTIASAFRESHFPYAYQEAAQYNLLTTASEFREPCEPRISKLKDGYTS